MSETTKIQWADATFNPWIGCTKVSAGCKNCYAENTTRARVLRSHGKETWGKGAQRSRTSVAYWKQPFKWDRQYLRELNAYNGLSINGQQHCSVPQRPRVFPSLCDVFDKERPIEWLADFLKLIYKTPNLDWLILTKRPENARDQLIEASTKMLSLVGEKNDEYSDGEYSMVKNWLLGRPPENVWLGVSCENQEMADNRVPKLLEIPAKVRFISAEPLLGPINFHHVSNPSRKIIDWVIVGGESGLKARGCNIENIEGIISQCRTANVPIFVKQLGAHPYDPRLAVNLEGGIIKGEPTDEDLKQIDRIGAAMCVKLLDKKGGDMAEWQPHLRVRQFPNLK